jgi:hypothetical protein
MTNGAECGIGPRVLVAATSLTQQAALLLADLGRGTVRPLWPFRVGGVAATERHLFLARLEGDRTRLEKYDRDGLLWMRRVPNCFDTHSLVVLDDRLALCSTGSNEVLFLDAQGGEIGRWTPDALAEGDSWHVNSLTRHAGRALVSCFGRFQHFRGWSGHVEGSGLLLDLETGQVVLEGLSAPHDPQRVEGGWIINESARSRTVFVPDAGPRQVLAELPGFARGLALFPDVLVVGSSAHRLSKNQADCATITLLDRCSGQMLRSLPIPFREIGHIVPAPPDDVLAAVEREWQGNCHCLLAQDEEIHPDDRAGGIAALSAFEPSPGGPDLFTVLIRVTNQGRALWSCDNRIPLSVSYQVIDSRGNPLFSELTRFPLPIPLTPGRSVTFPVTLDLALCKSQVAAAAIQITLVQERVAWWQKTALWSPALVELPEAIRSTAADRLLQFVRPEQDAQLHDLAATKQLLGEREQALADAQALLNLEMVLLNEVREKFQVSEQLLERTRAELQEAQNRLAPLEDLGPLALGVARRLRRTSLRFPRTASTFKRLRRYLSNLLG